MLTKMGPDGPQWPPNAPKVPKMSPKAFQSLPKASQSLPGGDPLICSKMSFRDRFRMHFYSMGPLLGAGTVVK